MSVSRFFFVLPVISFIYRFLIYFHGMGDIFLLMGGILVSATISWISVKILNAYVFPSVFQEETFLKFIVSLKGEYHILHIYFLIFSFILMFSCVSFLGKAVPVFGSR
jgi:hypothetical protein